MRFTAVIAALLGLGVALGLVVWQGIDPVLEGLREAGWGLVPVALYYLVPTGLDARGWQVLLPEGQRPGFPAIFWMRWIRDGVNRLLPVAQVGGDLVGARLLMQRGVPGAVAGASIVVDITLALVAQLVFTAMGLALLLVFVQARPVFWGALAALGAGTALIAGFLFAQHRGLFHTLLRWIAGMAGGGERWIQAMGGAARLDRAIRALYADRRRVARSTGWRLAAWVAGAGEVWLAMHFIGRPVSLAEALLLESLGQAIRNIGFTIPGALGVQEGGYMLLTALLGLGPETGLTLSLVKRVREVLLGVPALVSWQWAEGRRWTRRGR
jgi:putative membrane protein